MSPKNLLRHPSAKSSFDDMVEGSVFQRFIPEKGIASENPLSVKKILFCSGKVYYDLVKERDAKNLSDTIAISRVEQISPFPFDLIHKEILKYPRARICWAQEEHKNMGAWLYAQPRIEAILKTLKASRPRHVEYVGRHAAAAAATGNKAMHIMEVGQFMRQALEM